MSQSTPTNNLEIPEDYMSSPEIHSKDRAKGVTLLCGNANRPLAEKVARVMDTPLSACETRRFSDGEVFVQINDNIRGQDVFIIQPTNPPAENLMELLMIVDAARRASARRITAVLPYFGYARADRKDQPRVSIAAKLLANMLTAAGIDRALSIDLHASQIQGFFDIPTDHLYGSIIFHHYFAKKKLDNLCVLSPDVGSIKIARAFSKRLDIPLAIADKRRPGPNEAEVMNIIGDVAGKNIVMVDDMIDTAGTLTSAAKAAVDHGALDVYAGCTHAVLSGKALERIENSPLIELVVTDTIDLSQRELPAKIKVLSVAPLLSEAITRISNEESLTSLFGAHI
jgi:ribose-phosphate pyrophosphokinase